MLWQSEIETPSGFKAAVRTDPELVFLSGYLDGRRTYLTLATILEFDTNVIVLGRNARWQINVQKDGRRCLTTIVVNKSQRHRPPPSDGGAADA
jgi:hypothetical protein